MEFSFDMNQIPVIGYKKLEIPYHEIAQPEKVKVEFADDTYVTSWEKPRQCQVLRRFIQNW